MALTLTEETWIKKQKAIADLESEKDAIITTANFNMTSKQAEVEAIRQKMESDIAKKNGEIEALKSA